MGLMAQIFGVNSKVYTLSALGITTAWAVYATHKYYSYRKSVEANVYETPTLLDQYLLFHYGKPEEVLKWDFGPKDALEFPKRCADMCKKYFQLQPDIPSRALDIGCAVGRSAFELTTTFEEVLGMDFSHSFVQACCQLKQHGEMLYKAQEEGEIATPLIARLSENVKPSRATFEVGDACNLPLNLGQFGCVLAANLLCRLPTPKDFLARLTSLVAPGGIAVFVSPYTFLPEYTAKRHMFGGYMEGKKPLNGAEGLARHMSPCFELVAEHDMPFLIRETARENQWTVSHCSVWRRKRDV